MQFTAIIDVALGLVLVYLILSLICTTINEFFSTLFKVRATALEKTVSQLIDDKDLNTKFYAHGLIALSSLAASATKRPPAAAGRSAEVVAQGLAPAVQGAASPVLAAAVAPAAPPDKRKTGRPSYIDSRTFALALLGSLDPSKPVPGFADVQQLVSDLPASRIKDVLTAHISLADEDVTRLRDNVAAWFDTAMDRLSGDYVRYAKVLSLIVGLLLAVALNVDTLTLGRAIWNDHHLQNAAVSLGQTYAGKSLPTLLPPDAAQSTGAGSPSPSGTTVPAPDPTAIEKQLAEDANQVAAFTDNLREFPIGWPAPGAEKANLPYWLLKGLGWLITALALSLGAPFWFDLLQRLMSLRAAGSKPDPAPQSKDGSAD